MKITFKKIMGICLSMVLAISVSLPTYAFEYDKGHLTIKNNEDFENIDALNKDRIEAITFEDDVTSIGSSAFSGCTGLTSITIPDSVTSIGPGAFYGCTGLTSINIPNSVIKIGDGAFTGCNARIYRK